MVSYEAVLLLYSNARPKIAQVTQEGYMALNIEVLLHPSYLPDLVTRDDNLPRLL